MHLNEDLCTCYCMMIIIFYVTIITVAKCTTKVATMDTGTSPNMDTTPNVRTPDRILLQKWILQKWLTGQLLLIIHYC